MSQEKIKSMVDNIVSGNNLESESDFKNIMSDKVGETGNEADIFNEPTEGAIERLATGGTLTGASPVIVTLELLKLGASGILGPTTKSPIFDNVDNDIVGLL